MVATVSPPKQNFDEIQIPHTSILSEPNSNDDLGGDLPPSYQDPNNRNIEQNEPVQFAKHIDGDEIEANSEEDNDENNNDDEPYILRPTVGGGSGGGGGEDKAPNAETPLVSEEDAIDKIMEEQAMILDRIQKEQSQKLINQEQDNKIDDNDDEDQYVPPAPAPPSSVE
eukprot:509274_1